MSQVQLLRTLLKQRLTFADGEILGLFERTIAEYEEEMCRLKEENKLLKLLDAVFRPEVRLYRADMEQLVCKEDLLPGERKWDLCLDQKDSKLPNLNEEQEKLWTSWEEEQFHQLEEADFIKFPFTVVPGNTENEEKSQSSHLYQSQTDDGTDEEPLVSSTAEHSILKIKTDVDDCGRSHLASNCDSYNSLQPDNDGSSSVSSETETDDSSEWTQTSEPHLDLNFLKNSDVSVSGNGCSVANKQFNCSECEKIFSLTKCSRQHKRTLAIIKPKKCLKCGRRWSEKDHLNTHARTDMKDEQLPCSECGKIFKESHLNPQVSIHTGEKSFSCSDCAQTFREESSLNAQLIIHAGENPAGCSECGKRFATKGSLLRHMRTHTDVKPFACSKCGKAFREQRSLRKHMIIHMEHKPFGCIGCGKRFGEKSSLRRHMKVHTGEKPYGCSKCGQRFTESGSLKKHMRIHTGEKPYGCSDCGERFRLKCRLETHMTIHTGEKPFGCVECGKRFTENGGLKRHLRSHTGEKRFACSKCGKRFTEKWILNTHMSIHAGAQPFGCDRCGKRFADKDVLERHTRVHTGE